MNPNQAPGITIMLAGRTKTGKSTAWIRAFGQYAVCIATEVHAIAPAYNEKLNPPGKDGTKRIPRVAYCLNVSDPIGEVTTTIREQVEPLVRAGKVGAVVIDTISTLADREMEWIKRTVPKWDSFARGEKTLYGRIQTVLSELLTFGVVVVAVAHEREPSRFDIPGRATVFTPGGPKLPGKLVESSPSLFGTILRCTVRAGEDGAPERVFVCDPLDTEWITGDSWGVCAPIEPMDLKAIVRRIQANITGNGVK